jgi:zinc transporter ZupT
MSANTTVKLSLVDAIFRCSNAGVAALSGNTTGTLDKSVADVSLKVTPGEAKANTRNSRHELALPSMFVDEIEVSIPSDSASNAMTQLITACINAQPISCYVSDGVGMTGLAAVFGVFGWDDTETLNEVPVNKFTLKPYAVGAAGPFPTFC